MHLWTRIDNAWTALPLQADAYVFDPEAENDIRRPRRGEPVGGHVVLRSGPGAGGHRDWYLLVPGVRTARTNGSPIVTGVCRLRDRDEVRVSGLRQGLFFFSTESLARIRPIREGSNPVHCARCRQEIAVGSPSVDCPSCGMIHHQSDAFSCWTYADTCACCSQSTDLESGHLRWTPESS